MQSILLVGAGKMGGAMLRGWLAALDRSTRFVVLDPQDPPGLSEAGGAPDTRVTYVQDSLALPRDFTPDVILLATKPQLVEDVVKTLQGHIGPETTLISVAAGVHCATLKAAAPLGTSVARVMPNIGALVGHCVSAAYACADTSEPQKAQVSQLFEAIGRLTWLDDEDDLHLATAISGSGPAYYFAFCEAMIAAAQDGGLPPEVARVLAIGTVTAAGQLLAQDPDPTKLRDMVTSPNGTTAAGLTALTADGTLTQIARTTLDAAAKRSRELG